MNLTIALLLVVSAFITTIAAAIAPPRVPLWVPVLLLVLLELLHFVPLS